MLTDPRKFFVENVIPSYQDFIAHRKSNDWGENQLLRKGLIASTAIFHFREHIPEDIRPSKTSLRSQYPEYGLIGDISNVSKHHSITRDSPQISNASQIKEELRLIAFSDELGEYFFPQLEVYVELDNGTELKLVDILYDGMKMCCSVLSDLGIFDPAIPESPNIEKIISREEASKRKAEMQIRSGEEYKFIFRFEKYNYDKNIFEPKDMTGNNFQFTIYDLPKHIPINLIFQNPLGADIISIDMDVPLSEIQASQYIQLGNSKEKNEFLNNIILTTPTIKKELQSRLEEAIHANIKIHPE